MSLLKPAVFLDRDGTINIDKGYLYEIDKFQFIDGVIEACFQLKKMGFLLVVVTNQSGIGRNYYTEEQFLALTEWMDWSLADKGIDLDGIYYCPHDTNEQCDCRKPAPGMLLSAATDLNIDLAHSYMVGDKLIDIQAGKAAGVMCTVLVKTGKQVTEEIASQADWVIDSLADLPDKIKNKK